jgi:hypothetical protein
VDNASLFGINVGSTAYSGPLLQSFATGDAVDLSGFNAAGASLNFNSTTGLLQVTDTAGQLATLKMATASLGPGSFHATPDSGTGLLVTLS